MLVLTRKEGQGFMIGRHTSILVNRLKGNQVRIGITSPKGMPIVRNEVYQKKLEERRVADGEYMQPLYRAWSKAEPRRIQGYSLSLPDEASVRYDFEPITRKEDMTSDDHPLDLYMFSSEGEVKAFEEGIRLTQEMSSVEIGIVSEFLDGEWRVLVDHFDADWQDRPDILEIHDYTLYRYEETTNESEV